MGRRGVVVEIAPKNKVIVMTAQGEFIRVPFKKRVHVGQEIRITQKKERMSAWQLGLAATLFLALLGSWPTFTEWLIPVSIMPSFIITLDINPSLELQVSSDQTVLAVAGLNRDGKEFAARLAIIGDPLRGALDKVTAQAQKDGYLKQGQNQVIVTIASTQEQDVAASDLKQNRSSQHSALEKVVMEAFNATQIAQVRVWQVPRSLQTEAKLAGITPSRYLAIQAPAAEPVIPQRLEARLTMIDPPEAEGEVQSLGRASTLQANADTLRPALTPSQWTRQTPGTARSTDIYNVSFPVAAAKGDFRLYQ